MGTEELIEQLGSKDLLDKLYGFCYKRCNSSYEADDLCSEIILTLLKSIRKGTVINNFYAFTWTVAHRSYADFCEKRKQYQTRYHSDNYSDDICHVQENPIEEYVDNEADAAYFKKIKKNIAFLSKSYRDVMVMYYLDEMKLTEIAKALKLQETTVKQRLFSARNTIKKEVEKMDTSHIDLKPIQIQFFGTGKPVGNDPRSKAERTLSKNIVYLCKNTARSAGEISEQLHIPMLYVEEELEIQIHGENGQYGLLRKLDNGKFISNFILINLDDYKKTTGIFIQQADLITDRIKEYLSVNKKSILEFPFLVPSQDLKFIIWALITKMIFSFEHNVIQIIKEKYLSEVKLLERDFSTFGVALCNNQNMDIGFYGCDGIMSYNICGYSSVSIRNIYGDRIKKHFGCEHNISNDPTLLMTIKSIDGIDTNSLTNDEKETAAKAIEKGYMIKKNNLLFPKILTIDAKYENDFYNLSYDFSKEVDDITEETAKQLYELIKKLVPKHLMNEYDQLILHSASGLLNEVIEQCIQKGILLAPDRTPCAEGTWMIVEK